jgi:AcrR family transcriptional regulator
VVVVRRTQQERSEGTTAELVGAARDLFAEAGYAGTLLDDVVARAGVTKGALYHHFKGKRELFEAVFDREQAALAQVVHDAYAAQDDRWQGLHAGCRAYFEALLEPGAQRIVVVDGPAVLGRDRVREILDLHTLGGLRRGLETAVREGMIAPRPLEPLVQMLDGAICSAAVVVARSDDQRAATEQVLAELRLILDALRT